MKGFKGGGGMQQLMKQANQMQNRMKKVQEELAEKEYEGTSGGGAVKVTVNGEYLITKVELDDEVLSPDEKEMVQDMILTATNEAIKVAKDTSEKEMSKITGGMGHAGDVLVIQNMPSFEKLVHELSRLPGIGPKTAQRLAYYVLRSSNEYAFELSEALRQLPEKVRQCTQCFTYTENEELCHYCSDLKRDGSVLCVVEEPSDISRIDSSGVFRGCYHVLHGVISPLDGVEPEDLTIEPLLKRVQNGIEGSAPVIKEIIFALDADLEGDTTVLYLARILRDKGVNISRIAHGVPIGGDIDYIDNRTLGRALENRITL